MVETLSLREQLQKIVRERQSELRLSDSLLEKLHQAANAMRYAVEVGSISDSDRIVLTQGPEKDRLTVTAVERGYRISWYDDSGTEE